MEPIKGEDYLLDDVFTIHGGVQDVEIDCFVATDVCFARDFGPWKAGASVECIRVDFELGVMESVDAAGKTVRSCKLRLEAK